jgi:hypothetical protein
MLRPLCHLFVFSLFYVADYLCVQHSSQLKNPYMSYAKFHADFIGDTSSVTASDNFLKQSQATHFVMRYNPRNPGVSNGSLVIQAEVNQKSLLCVHVICPIQIVFPSFQIAAGLQDDLEDCWKHWRI